jgi:hypothetical protein
VHRILSTGGRAGAPTKTAHVANVPDELDLPRHRDPSSRAELVVRWIVLGLLTVFAAAGLLGAFGQRAGSVSASADGASLEVSAPARLRGGLIYQGRFVVEADAPIERPVLVLQPGWLEGMSVNTIEPAPTEEAGRDGDLALVYGPLSEGERLVVYMQFQVNPTTVGRRSAGVELLDGETPLAHVERTVTVFP